MSGCDLPHRLVDCCIVRDVDEDGRPVAGNAVDRVVEYDNQMNIAYEPVGDRGTYA